MLQICMTVLWQISSPTALVHVDATNALMPPQGFFCNLCCFDRVVDAVVKVMSVQRSNQQLLPNTATV